MTATSTARVACERPARYAKQLASHFAKKIETRFDPEEGRGHLSFSREQVRGEVEMIVGDGVLLLQIDTDDDYLEKVESVVGRHLVRFGTRDRLEVRWARPGGVEGLYFPPVEDENPDPEA
ncbi:DUF2218 domain-containing protein [Corynebacterium yudongzhengii]|uniref:DUF2218 domain-containing protein n=1 Tax=Corynebacterium yudongzhengii TaxID=2080740 RepID=A0A2U1T4A0_9CORY|nr:DUF2218 domain-containing protein [Corynebacterium yudongzhengii]AWB82179.1 DUF2218 domain-containing protein [Corynebacterium yudongzhengii]PWC00718.1 DUF2218 domain-containing protein [Corynebacterium yudongzhengii]